MHCQRPEYGMKLLSSLAFQVDFPLVPCTGMLRVTVPCPAVGFQEITSPSLVVAKLAGTIWEMRSQPGLLCPGTVRAGLSLADKMLGFWVCISFIRGPSKERLMSNAPVSVVR